MAVLGVDVSSYQPVAFDTKGLAFAFVKATEGTGYTNPRYSGQVAHARSAGLVVGHYHFGKAGNGAAQADYFLSKLSLKAGDILAFDWEDSGVTQGERDAFVSRVKAKAPGHKVLLYCNTDFWKSRDSNNGGPMDGLWIADPNRAAGKPGIQHAWTFHQYSFSGGIDKNVANFKDAAALRAWCAPAVAKPAPVPAKPAPAGGHVADVLRISKGEIGYHEGKNASGHWNNIQKYSPAVPGLEWSQGQAWCATFVSWVALKAGVANLFPRTASCADAVAWFKQAGRFSAYPAIGAQVFYGPGGGSHTGIVVDYDADTITTVEGNTNNNGSAEGDGVYLKKRNRRDVNTYGYGYPKYAEGIKSADPAYASQAPKPAPAPVPVKPAPAPAPAPKPVPAPVPAPAPAPTMEQRVSALEAAVKALQLKVK
jgi:hypothetical protein